MHLIMHSISGEGLKRPSRLHCEAWSTIYHVHKDERTLSSVCTHYCKLYGALRPRTETYGSLLGLCFA